VTLEDGALTIICFKSQNPGYQPGKVQAAYDAKANCPISKSLKSAISLDANLG
jgi:hypothetical protein